MLNLGLEGSAGQNVASRHLVLLPFGLRLRRAALLSTVGLYLLGEMRLNSNGGVKREGAPSAQTPAFEVVTSTEPLF